MKFIDCIVPPDKIYLLYLEKPKRRFPFWDVLAVLVCLVAVFGFHIFFTQANPSAKVQFIADAILSLTGISDGDLYIANGSKCDQLTVSGSTLTVSGIPDGSNFILKTPQRSNALKLTLSNPAPMVKSISLMTPVSRLKYLLLGKTLQLLLNLIWFLQLIIIPLLKLGQLFPGMPLMSQI